MPEGTGGGWRRQAESAWGREGLKAGSFRTVGPWGRCSWDSEESGCWRKFVCDFSGLTLCKSKAVLGRPPGGRCPPHTRPGGSHTRQTWEGAEVQNSGHDLHILVFLAQVPAFLGVSVCGLGRWSFPRVPADACGEDGAGENLKDVVPNLIQYTTLPRSQPFPSPPLQPQGA